MNQKISFARAHKQISIFVTAGYPALEDLNAQLELLENSGIDFVEVGIPFSDPLADGPVIQESSRLALQNGMTLERLFAQLAQRNTKLPIVLMGYLNPILHFGLERFLSACETVGIYTVILPDLSPEIYQRCYQSTFEKTQVRNVFIVSLHTSAERIEQIARLCAERFVYLVSGNATTGGSLSAELPEKKIEKIREGCQPAPLFMGFGIQDTADIARVHNLADGAIIGSAFLRALASDQASEFLQKIAPDKKNPVHDKK